MAVLVGGLHLIGNKVLAARRGLEVARIIWRLLEASDVSCVEKATATIAARSTKGLRISRVGLRVYGDSGDLGLTCGIFAGLEGVLGWDLDVPSPARLPGEVHDGGPERTPSLACVHQSPRLPADLSPGRLPKGAVEAATREASRMGDVFGRC